MSSSGKSAPYLLAEVRAHENWKIREYRRAYEFAGEAALIAEQNGDSTSSWNMARFQIECLLEDGAFQECVREAQLLVAHPLSKEVRSFGVKALILLGLAYQGLGRLPEAARTAAMAAATAAEDLERNPDLRELQVQALRALIAALAESDQLDDAWRECLNLVELLDEDIDDQTAGKSYWAIGNVAFMRKQVEDGRKYHELAAEHLSPTNDVDLWAKFNKASASVRLAAGIADAETLRCIDRAELATDVVIGSQRDRLQVTLARAHWHLLTGDVETAARLLRAVCAHSDELSAQTSGEAYFLLARALHTLGLREEAISRLEDAGRFFAKANATDRSAQARALVEEWQSA